MNISKFLVSRKLQKKKKNRPSPRPRTDESLSIRIIAQSIKYRVYAKGGEGRGRERRAYAYVNVARRPSVRKSHWPFREITLTAKLPRNIATPRVIGEKERRGEARRTGNQLHDVSIFQLFYESRPFIYFFFFRAYHR